MVVQIARVAVMTCTEHMALELCVPVILALAHKREGFMGFGPFPDDWFDAPQN